MTFLGISEGFGMSSRIKNLKTDLTRWADSTTTEKDEKNVLNGKDLKGSRRMTMLFRRQIEKLVRFYFHSCYWSGMPEADLDDQVAFVQWFMGVGAPEFKILYMICIISLHLFSLILRRRTFHGLSEQGKEEFLERLLRSRNTLLRGVPVLLSLPVLISYYRRDEVRIPMGFDPLNLKKDAEKHLVTRNGAPVPEKEEVG